VVPLLYLVDFDEAIDSATSGPAALDALVAAYLGTSHHEGVCCLRLYLVSSEEAVKHHCDDRRRPSGTTREAASWRNGEVFHIVERGAAVVWAIRNDVHQQDRIRT
jgi:hypothetical protein